MFKSIKFLIVGIGIFAVGCESIKEDLYNRKQSPLKTINPSYLDHSTRPNEDFYQFTNGKWLANQKDISNRNIWDDSYKLTEENNAKLLAILTDTLTKEAAMTPNVTVLQTYFSAFFDKTLRKQQTDERVEDIKSKMKSVQKKEDVNTVLFSLTKQKINVLFEIKVGPSMRIPKENTLYFSQSELGLRNKNLYFGDINSPLHQEYTDYIAQIFKLMNLEDSEERARSVFNFESELARIQEYQSSYAAALEKHQSVEFTQAEELINFVDFKKLIEEAKASFPKEVVFEQQNYVKELHELIEKVDLVVLKDYITWKYMDHYLPFLDESFAKYYIHFDEFSTKFRPGYSIGSRDTGIERKTVKANKLENTYILENIKNSSLEPILSYEFSHRYFSKSDKIKIGQIVDGIYSSSKERIEANQWMSPETKSKALKKLNTLTLKIGSSAIIPENKGPKLSTNNCLRNIDIYNALAFDQEMQELSMRSNPHTWETSSFSDQIIYNPINNSLEIPAGIIQPPFFDSNAGEVYNYGKIGVLIAHEMIHAFDALGGQFNEEGIREGWWSKADKENYSALSERFGETFSKICPFKEKCIDEKRTELENIAELGGVSIAYTAYSKTKEFRNLKTSKDYTSSQTFFITYSQMRKSFYSKSKLISILENESFSPAKYRVNGTLMNLFEFQKAFESEKGNKMWKRTNEIPSIW